MKSCMLRFHLCLNCILVLALAGCQVRKPSHVLSEPKMEALLYDYHLAKSMGDNLPYNENYKKALYVDAVLRKHDVTQAEFDSSLVWYTRHTDALSKIYEKVKKRLRDEQELVNDLIARREKKTKTTAEGDSIDVWPWQRLMRLTDQGGMDNLYEFVMPVDTNYKERDTLVWEVRYRFAAPLQIEPLRQVTMAMQVLYEKDTIEHWRSFFAPGKQQIRLFADTLGKIQEIRGFIYYTVAGENTDATLLADGISMMRYHCRDTLDFSVRDSLNKAEQLRKDSLQHVEAREEMDTTSRIGNSQVGEGQARLTPEEMNRRRTGQEREIRPEQKKVEEHILQERRERQQQQRRQQQRRRQNSY